jgi:hypothetical protein
MTVKELKEKIEKLPDDAVVKVVILDSGILSAKGKTRKKEATNISYSKDTNIVVVE